MSRSTIIIAGGGTGGHLFPGMALAEAFEEAGYEPVFAGTERGIEARVIPETDWRLHLIPVKGLKGTGIRALARLFLVPMALLRSFAIIRKEKPAFVIGVGGYASGPLVMAAALMGIPTAILEQNSVPGITNRVLGKVVKRVFINFSEAAPFFPEHKIRVLGNPIRKKIVSQLKDVTTPGPDRHNLLVIGGSQGAKGVNRAMAEAAGHLTGSGIVIRHQTGGKDTDLLSEAYTSAGLDFTLEDFIQDMAQAYEWSTVIVARAGATTLSELAIVGRPAILIPFPHATDNHQYKNAMELVRAGAAEIMTEDGLDPAALAETIRDILADEERYMRMAEAMKSLARPDAALLIRDEILALK